MKVFVVTIMGCFCIALLGIQIETQNRVSCINHHLAHIESALEAMRVDEVEYAPVSETKPDIQITTGTGRLINIGGVWVEEVYEGDEEL